MRGWGAHLPRTPPCGRSSSLVPYASLSIRTTQSLPPINGWRPVLVIPSGQSGHANERPNTCPSRSSRRGTAFLGRSQPGWRPPPATPPRRAEPAPERARGLPPPPPPPVGCTQELPGGDRRCSGSRCRSLGLELLQLACTFRTCRRRLHRYGSRSRRISAVLPRTRLVS